MIGSLTTEAPPQRAQTGRLTARRVLFGDEESATVRRRLTADRVLERAGDGLTPLPDAARRLLTDQIGQAAEGFLDVDLAGAAVSGWQRHRPLVDAARQTLAETGASRLVGQVSHHVTSTWQPRVDVVLGSTPLGHVEFELRVDLRLSEARAVVENGHLTHLAGGRCEATVRLTAGARTLAVRTTEVDPRSAFPLGDGVPLVDAAGSSSYVP